MRTTVAIVEDNAGICRELQLALARASDLECVAVCRNVATALQHLPKCAPDVIVMDIQLPDGSGIDCTTSLAHVLPRTQILMFTICAETAQIMSALAAGAVGYILKDASSEEIIDAIREARGGGAPLTDEVARKVVESLHQNSTGGHCIAHLTQREREVLQLLSRGAIDKQIADQLAISLQTVNTHLKHIYGKLQVHSRTEAVVKYLQ